MEKSDRKLLVVGAGAIGGITAVLLRNNGYDVEILCRDEEYASFIRTQGISISGVRGDLRVRMPAYASASQITSRKDFILLATKATDMIAAVNDILPLLSSCGQIVSMQNGICEESIASVAGKDRVIGCVTGWGATMTGHGKLAMTSSGEFIIGYPGRSPDEYLGELAFILSSVVPVKVTDNIMGHRYSKLIINACVTSLGAICGLYLGSMLLNMKIRRIFIEIVSEAMNVADAMQLKVEIFGGKLDFRIFQRAGGYIALLKCHIILLVIGYSYRKIKSSSLQSLERGQRTEIDFLNGYIVSNGTSRKIGVPVNSMIVKIIHEIEDGIRKIGMENFDDPFFNRFD